MTDLAHPCRALIYGVALTLGACRPQISAQVPDAEPARGELTSLDEAGLGTPAPAPLVFVETEGDALGERAPDPLPSSGEAAAEIAMLSEEGSSSAWDDEVKRILLRDFDADGSGVLDRAVEVEAIPCSVFHILDQVVEENRGSTITAVYGFDYDYIWVGDVIGFDEAQRVPIAQAMGRCGLDFETPP